MKESMWTEATTGNGGAKQALAVEWHDCGWVVAIEQRGADAVREGCIKPLPRVVPLAHAGRRQTKTMMKQRMGGGRRYEAGFTLVELLTVIAIIAILAAMLLPVLSRVKLSAYRTQARVQVNDIATAIQAYDSAYGRFPVSPGAQQQAAAYGGGDITYCGGYFTNAAGTQWPVTPTPTYCDTSNAEVISILMDYTNFPDSTYGNFTANTNYQKNPQKTGFLNAKMSGWGPKPGAGAPLPGVGTDLVYRDPWGNPYIMTMDLNYDGQCQDAFYGLQAVSQNSVGGTYAATGFNGLNNPSPTQPGSYLQLNDYAFHGSVMVWSMGQYGPATPALSSFDSGKPATDAANKNHILSWQQ